MEESLEGSDYGFLITGERDSSTLRLRRIARNDIRRKEIPRLATLARNDEIRGRESLLDSSLRSSLGMTIRGKESLVLVTSD